LADYKGSKKLFMAIFCYLGALSCSLLFTFGATSYEWGVILFSMATVGYSGSIVFYNAYLPSIASHDRIDQVSARGYSLGYVGSLLIQIACLIPVLMPNAFGITAGLGLRISFLAVGLWWGLWAIWPLSKMPAGVPAENTQGHWLTAGFRELGTVWKQAREVKPLFRFLVAYLFYNMGVQTVMTLATLFGAEELKLESHKLIITVILLQAVAIGGAALFSRLSLRLLMTKCVMFKRLNSHTCGLYLQGGNRFVRRICRVFGVNSGHLRRTNPARSAATCSSRDASGTRGCTSCRCRGFSAKTGR
jgi:UMF1 family MFS transporter